MQEKDKFLKKTSKVIIIFILFISGPLFAENTKLQLLNYNNSLKNSSALFIQTDGKTIEEGIIYIGSERIKMDYKKPKKITIVLSEKKGMYVDHELKETQYFNTHKSFVNIFFKILTSKDFYKNSKINFTDNSITIRDDFETNKKLYKTKIVYENKPIKLRKIEVRENGEGLEIGFYNHNDLEDTKKEFFSLINPYIN